MNLDPFIASTTLVTVAEIGDKTQLLALVLAARYRRPVPIILGILVATLLNHALAAWTGHWLGLSANQAVLGWLVSLFFIAIGIWALIPDTLEEESAMQKSHRGVFMATAFAFFLAETGDKTQLATVALGAQYAEIVQVVAGTTLGMLVANVPAVLFGDRILRRIPLAKVRYAASALFIGFGLTGVWNMLH